MFLIYKFCNPASPAVIVIIEFGFDIFIISSGVGDEFWEFEFMWIIASFIDVENGIGLTVLYVIVRYVNNICCNTNICIFNTIVINVSQLSLFELISFVNVEEEIFPIYIYIYIYNIIIIKKLYLKMNLFFKYITIF